MSFVAPTPAEVDGPSTGPDRPILEGYLDWQRRTLLNICAGLDETQLAMRPIASSQLSLLGLVAAAFAQYREECAAAVAAARRSTA